MTPVLASGVLEAIVVPLVAATLGGSLIAAVLADLRERRRDRSRGPLERESLRVQIESLSVGSMEKVVKAQEGRIDDLKEEVRRLKAALDESRND